MEKLAPVLPFEEHKGGPCDWSMIQVKDGGIEATLEGLVDSAKECV